MMAGLFLCENPVIDIFSGAGKIYIYNVTLFLTC